MPLATSILIVDDSEVDCATYIRYLTAESEESYQIIKAETLDDGLHLCRSQKPDIVLLDFSLPDGDGLDFLEAISQDLLDSNLAAIMLTGQGDERTAVKALKLGAADYLLKGDVTAVSLATCVHQVRDRLLIINQLRLAQQQQAVIAQMSLLLRQYFSIEDISNAIVQELRSFLSADRVIIYRFNPDMSGTVVAEAIISPWTPCLNAQINDTCFRENMGGAYREGRFFAAADIHTANLTECHEQLLARFQVRANLVMPILLTNEQPTRLWGLLIVHQCSAPRQWVETDIQLLQQLSVHLAIALQQAELYQSIQELNSSLEQKIAERTKELLFQNQVLEEIHDAVISTDTQGNILSWNHGAENLFGYQASETLGQNIKMLYSSEQELQTQVIQPLLSKDTHQIELPINTKTGKQIYVGLRLSIVRDQDGNITRLVGCSNDISDRKQAEIQLQQTNEELMRTTRLKDEFLANMSHELRTPLNAILGMSESLIDLVMGNLNEKQIKAVQLIEKSGQHLLELINDILDLSKIASGKMELNIHPTSLEALCKSSLAFVRQQAFQKNIQIDSSIDSTIANIYINVDERRIRQVLINLLINAVKFTPSHGKVSLSVSISLDSTWQTEPNTDVSTATHTNGINEISGSELATSQIPMLLFQVKDTGIGIEPKDLGRLFQPFIQLDSNLNRQYEGTGLGLAMVKQIITMHGGKVTVESQLGQGSCFTVALPYQHLSSDKLCIESVAETDDSPNSAPAAIAPLILLAEDNKANIDTFSAYLLAFNYRLAIAQNGVEALKLIQAQKPDIILMDIQMPVMDGLEAIRLIRADPQTAQIPIIALTALAMENDESRCLEAGANDYMTKPIKLKQLLQKIQQTLQL